MIQLAPLVHVARTLQPADAPGDEPVAPPDHGDPSAAGAVRSVAALHVRIETPAPVDDGAAQREEEARRLVEQGLQGPAPVPPPSQAELDALAARIAAADDDASVGLANDPRAMAIATPAQKAALVRKLMDGHTNADEERAIKAILLSCNSKGELDQVIGMAGGFEAVADELEEPEHIRAVADHAAQLANREAAAAEQAVALLEQAQSPEEFMRLYAMLGGDSLKMRLAQGDHGAALARLDALGAKYGVAGVGFNMPPERVAALQQQIQLAIDNEDDAAIVRLSENPDAMRVATPAQKAKMVRVLQSGWTKDSQDMAIARILGSCANKAEFDQVLDMAGGPEVIEDIDFDEAKAELNKLMGGFDRIDCADDKATATAFRGALMPPAVDGYSRARPPTDEEVMAVLGLDAMPADAAGREAFEATRARMGREAYDVQNNPMARNELALTNREREMHGQPPLDYTQLVADAYAAVNDPAVEAEIERAVATAEAAVGPLDGKQRQEIREQVLGRRLADIAARYGLSEQAMKTLVTAKMGHVLQDGARAVAATGQQVLVALERQLHEVERTAGRDSPEARRLRNEMATTARTTQNWAARLQANGVAAGNLFKVPPSFAEDFVNALSVIGDVLAVVVNVIPGVGQAISGAYFGVKAIVAAANGDLLGAFKSLLSAVPGFSGVLGAAGAVVNTGARLAQAGIAAGESIDKGDVLGFLGAVGGMGGAVGFDPTSLVPGAVKDAIDDVKDTVESAVDGLGDVRDAVEEGVDLARRGAKIADDIGNASLADLLRAGGAGALADAIDGIAASPAAQAFRQTTGHVAGFLDAAGRNDAGALGDVFRQWTPALAGHEASRSIARLADQARDVLRSSAWFDARRSAPKAAQLVAQDLQRMAQLASSAAAMRDFEDRVGAMGLRQDTDWTAFAAALLRALELDR